MSQLKLDLSYYFDTIKARSRSIKGVIDHAEVESADVPKPITFANELSNDLFNTLYQVNPQIMRTKTPNQYNEVLRGVANSESFKKIRTATTNQLTWSSVGSAIIIDELLKSGEDFGNEKYPGDDELEADNGDSNDGDGKGKGKDGTQKSRAVARAIDNAAERMEDIMNGLSAGRGNSIPTVEDSAADVERIATLMRLPRIKEFFRRVGKLRVSAQFLPSLDVGDPQEVTDITVGRNLPSVLPQDLALVIGNDQEFAIFAEKYSNSELLQFKTKAATRSGEGPMIVCVDQSGSMGMDDRMEWAKAITAAAYLHALKKHRPFAAIFFNDAAKRYEPKSNKTLDSDLLERIATTRAGGGTSFQAAWNSAMQMMAKQANNKWRKADVVFITDGDGYIDSDWSIEKKKYSTRLFSFFIGCDDTSYRVSDLASKLGEYSDLMSFLPNTSDSTAEAVTKIITTSKKQK